MSRCYAMVTGVPTDFKAFFWAISPVRPSLLPNLACQFETSQFAEAIPCEGTESDRGLLGSEVHLWGLKNYCRRAIVLTNSVQCR